MRLDWFEHSRFGYFADFGFYALLILVLGGVEFSSLALGHRAQAVVLIGLGVIAWTLLEYLVHRHVLHGLEPFSRWHAAHHERPRALLATPTPITAGLFAVLIFLPLLWLGSLWSSCAITLGILTGFVAYSCAHHAVHHARGQSSWLIQRKRWHALHHRPMAQECYGVSTAFWDHVFCTSHR